MNGTSSTMVRVCPITSSVGRYVAERVGSLGLGRPRACGDHDGTVAEKRLAGHSIIVFWFSDLGTLGERRFCRASRYSLVKIPGIGRARFADC
jgi:hypothetical protein